MDRKKALEKIRHLIAIATDSSQRNEKEEPSELARTSAFVACKLIKEWELLEEAPPAKTAPPPPEPPPSKQGAWSKAWRKPRSSRRHTSKPAERRPNESAESFGTRRGTFTRARSEDRCLYCSFVIHRGDPIFEMPGFGMDHERCAYKRAGIEVE